jgi:hypothetical protein
MRNIFVMVLALAVASGSALALEAATTGSQATQATVGAINSKVDVTTNFISSIMKCNAVRKFYAPSDPKKDSDGCVGVGDYDLNMASGSNINLANGQVSGTLAAASQYMNYFTGNGFGLRSQASTYGVVGVATGNPSGDTVGVYGYTSTAGWGGYFYSPASGGGSVMIYNAASNAKLCLNGTCVLGLHDWGGDYSYVYGTFTGVSSGCSPNPYTGACSCPSGYQARGNISGQGYYYREWDSTYYHFTCYR